MSLNAGLVPEITIQYELWPPSGPQDPLITLQGLLLVQRVLDHRDPPGTSPPAGPAELFRCCYVTRIRLSTSGSGGLQDPLSRRMSGAFAPDSRYGIEEWFANCWLWEGGAQKKRPTQETPRLPRFLTREFCERILSLHLSLLSSDLRCLAFHHRNRSFRHHPRFVGALPLFSATQSPSAGTLKPRTSATEGEVLFGSLKVMERS